MQSKCSESKGVHASEYVGGVPLTACLMNSNTPHGRSVCLITVLCVLAQTKCEGRVKWFVFPAPSRHATSRMASTRCSFFLFVRQLDGRHTGESKSNFTFCFKWPEWNSNSALLCVLRELKNASFNKKTPNKLKTSYIFTHKHLQRSFFTGGKKITFSFDDRILIGVALNVRTKSPSQTMIVSIY